MPARLLGVCLWENVVVHGYPLLSLPRLPSDGHQAYVGLVTDVTLPHLFA